MARVSKLIVRGTVAVLIVGSAVSVLFWIGYTKLKGYSSNPLTYSSCISETQAQMKNVDGWDFDVEYTNCDTLAKDEAIRIFATSSQANKSRWNRWFARRRLVFEYDPGSWNDPPLTIKGAGANRVLISLPRASSVFVKNRTVGTTVVDYDIGKIDYP